MSGLAMDWLTSASRSGNGSNASGGPMPVSAWSARLPGLTETNQDVSGRGRRCGSARTLAIVGGGGGCRALGDTQ
jgi:hypothetical protein